MTLSVCWATLTQANPFQHLENFNSLSLADNLYVLKSSSSNTNIGVFIGKHFVVLIDPVPGNANNEALAKAVTHVAGKPIKYVINTHDHIDHSGANQFYTERGAIIVQQQDDFDGNDPQKIAFKKQYVIELDNEQIELLHISSHSSHDVLVHFKNSNVIFMGDTYMHNAYPHAFVGGSEGLTRVIDKTLELSDNTTQLVTAHGRFSTKTSELITFKNDANKWYQLIEKFHNQGKTKDEMLKDETLITLSKKFKPFSAGFFELMLTKTLKKEHGAN